jgi:hypothetical protein
MFRAFLGRRWQGRQALAAQDSAVTHGQAARAQAPAVQRRQAPPEAGFAGREVVLSREARMPGLTGLEY